MRIIAGTARRVELEVAENAPTRPFLELARGALFNSLGEQVVGAKVLDLYAGSGALGLEALSRGAKACLFVERDKQAVTALKKNILRCGFERRARVAAEDVFSAVRGDTARRVKWDLIFADPPFPDAAAWGRDGGGDKLAAALASVLADDGILVLRVEKTKQDDENQWRPEGLHLMRTDVYGRSRVCRYRRN